VSGGDPDNEEWNGDKEEDEQEEEEDVTGDIV